jgi:hypothetical protein
MPTMAQLGERDSQSFFPQLRPAGFIVLGRPTELSKHKEQQTEKNSNGDYEGNPHSNSM